jgi:hypothetical protein
MKKNRKGFILVESQIGLFLLASIILSSVSSFVVGKYATRLSKERFVVSNLLREDMESFLSASYSDTAYPPPASVVTNITIADGLRTFSATKTLEYTTIVAGIYGYKKIYGKIAWAGGISGTRALQEEMVLYVTKQ